MRTRPIGSTDPRTWDMRRSRVRSPPRAFLSILLPIRPVFWRDELSGHSPITRKLTNGFGVVDVAEVLQNMEHLTEDDVGKTVRNQHGDEIGRVTGVEGHMMMVDPDPNLDDSIKARFGWEDPDADDYRLEMDEVETVTDDEIRLS